MSDKQDIKRIKPHKGGRTERFECRTTPAVKANLFELAKSRGITTADLVEQWVLESKILK